MHTDKNSRNENAANNSLRESPGNESRPSRPSREASKEREVSVSPPPRANEAIMKKDLDGLTYVACIEMVLREKKSLTEGELERAIIERRTPSRGPSDARAFTTAFRKLCNSKDIVALETSVNPHYALAEEVTPKMLIDAAIADVRRTGEHAIQALRDAGKLLDKLAKGAS
jgi:hypothetical protein